MIQVNIMKEGVPFPQPGMRKKSPVQKKLIIKFEQVSLFVNIPQKPAIPVASILEVVYFPGNSASVKVGSYWKQLC